MTELDRVLVVTWGDEVATDALDEREYMVDVVETPTAEDDRAGCVICRQPPDRPASATMESLENPHVPLVYVYDDRDSGTQALEAGADAAVPADDGAHLAATVETVTDGHRADVTLGPALDELPDILFVATLDGRVLWWNDRLEAVTGYTGEEIASMQPLELFDAQEVERIEHTIGRAVVNGEATVVAELTTSGDRSVTHEFTGSLTEIDGEMVIVGTARDISDRLERKRALEAQAERLAAVNHVNGLIRDLMRVLLAADTRNELLADVCDRLTRPDGYRLAWIGRYDDDAGHVEPEIWAGEGVSYLQDRPTPDDGGEMVTALTAIREERVVFADDVAADTVASGWRSAALEHGHRAAAAIPLTYDDLTYGCLCLYAAEADAFGPLERDVLGELGGIIAHAVHALETRRALVTDTVTELQFKITDPDSFLVQAAEFVDAELSLVGTVAQPDGAIMQLFAVAGLEPDAVERLLQVTPVPAEVVTRRESECVVKVTVEDYSLAHVLARVGGRIHSIEVRDGEVSVRSRVPRTVNAGEVLERIEDVIEIEFLARREVEREGRSEIDFRADVERRLTDRQLEVLETAYSAGFFARPREKTGEEVAELLGISAPTFHEHFRVAERKLLEVLFDRGPPDDGGIGVGAVDRDRLADAAAEVDDITGQRSNNSGAD